jgi:hypothetical protein
MGLLLKLFETFRGQGQIGRRCAAGLLDKAVQQNHVTSNHAEQNPCNTGFQPYADFPKVFGHLAHQRHAERPAKLHGFQDLRKRFPARRIGDDSTGVRLADLNDAGGVLRKSWF